MELREKTEFCGPAEPKKHLAQTAQLSKVQGGLVPALGEFNVGAVANAANLWRFPGCHEFQPCGAQEPIPGLPGPWWAAAQCGGTSRSGCGAKTLMGAT